MARPELPAEEHWLRGTESQRKTPRESRYAGGRPKMPKDLPPAAIEEWKRLCKSLSARGTITKTDASAMEIYCRAFAHWRSACLDVDTNGIMVEDSVLDKNGNEVKRRVKNPCVQMATQFEHLLARYLASFSATPASREKTKPAAPPAPKKTELIPGTVAWIEAHSDEIMAASEEEKQSAEEYVPESEQEDDNDPV